MQYATEFAFESESFPNRPPQVPLRPAEDLTLYLRQYAREKPEMLALCCLFVGFVLGWKLKPW